MLAVALVLVLALELATIFLSVPTTCDHSTFKLHLAYMHTYIKPCNIMFECHDHSSRCSGQVREGLRNMKSMWLPSVAIFFMTYFHRAGGARGPLKHSVCILQYYLVHWPHHLKRACTNPSTSVRVRTSTSTNTSATASTCAQEQGVTSTFFAFKSE